MMTLTKLHICLSVTQRSDKRVKCADGADAAVGGFSVSGAAAASTSLGSGEGARQTGKDGADASAVDVREGLSAVGRDATTWATGGAHEPRVNKAEALLNTLSATRLNADGIL